MRLFVGNPRDTVLTGVCVCMTRTNPQRSVTEENVHRVSIFMDIQETMFSWQLITGKQDMTISVLLQSNQIINSMFAIININITQRAYVAGNEAYDRGHGVHADIIICTDIVDHFFFLVNVCCSLQSNEGDCYRN